MNINIVIVSENDVSIQYPEHVSRQIQRGGPDDRGRSADIRFVQHAAAKRGVNISEQITHN